MLSARACKALGAIVGVNMPGLIAANIDLQPIQENDAFFCSMHNTFCDLCMRFSFVSFAHYNSDYCNSIFNNFVNLPKSPGAQFDFVARL